MSFPIVYVRYLDHVLFKAKRPERVRIMEREAVGWLIKETDRAVWIVSDRLAGSKSRRKQADDVGLIILKSDILEMKRLC